MKFFFLLLALFLSLIQQSITVDSKVLSRFIGNWSGTLTYLDYQTSEPYSLPLELAVEQKKKNKVSVNYTYPNEPKANSKESFSLSKDGTTFNNRPIIYYLKGGDVGEEIIITEYIGKDDNQTATIKETYIISDWHLRVYKEVQFDSSQEWIKRNEFYLEKQ